MVSGYFEFIWPGERLVIHESELRDFHESGEISWMPAGQYEKREWDGVEHPETRFWGKCPTVSVGDYWTEQVNHSQRDGEVVAVDPQTGQFLWEYAMPGGTTAVVRYWWKQGRLTRRGIPYRQLDERWLRLIDQDWFLGNSQRA
jgi:hypothetical protein